MKYVRLEKRLRQLRRKELSSAHFRFPNSDLDIGCEIICSYYCCTRLNGSSASHPASAGRRPGWTGDLDSSSLQQRIISSGTWAVRTGRPLFRAAVRTIPTKFCLHFFLVFVWVEDKKEV